MFKRVAKAASLFLSAVLLAAGTATVTTGPAWADPPPALPAGFTEADGKWQPALDYDEDGCYPTPAIGPDGTLNPGMTPTSGFSAGCRDESDLDSTNAYSRSRCNQNGWCAYMYDLYFEKDVMNAPSIDDNQLPLPETKGHRHDWEHIVVWVNEGLNPGRASYVSVSAHGGYSTYPFEDVAFEGTHPKIVYHKDGILTHAFRLASASEEPENHKGTWQYPGLVGWNHYPSGIRDKLTEADWGSASIGIKDQNDSFKKNLASAKPEGIDFNPDEDHVPPGGDPGHPDLPDVRMMPLGDSITHGIGSSSQAGYRLPLQTILKVTLAGSSLDMVGTQRDGPQQADRDHEGYPGKRIDQIVNAAACAVPMYRPNVVTLHIGTNDMNQGYHLSTAPERLGALIDQILDDAPETTVLVATLVPSTKAGLQSRIDAYNKRIPKIVQQRRDQGKHVRLVNMNAVTTSDLAQPAHPNDNGYLKMAMAFIRGVIESYNDGWLKDPVDGSGKGCAVEEPADESAAGPGWRALGVIAPGMDRPQGRTDIVELDGDNRGDYVRIAADGSVRAALNTVGQPGKPNWEDQEIISPGRGHGPEAVRFADVNGDGRDDYLLVGEAGSVRAWQNNGPGAADGPYHWTDLRVIAPGVKGATREALRFADVNGDGRDDYLRTGEDGSVHAYFNFAHPKDRYKVQWEEHLNWAPGVSYGSRDKLRLADVDGDRKADYLMIGNSGAVHAYINDGGGGGGGFTPYLYFVNETGYPGNKSTFRDISGDGKADYVVIYDGGSVRAWLNRGGNIGGS
ncbi:NPP1 family protein [Nonomuraea lactucae]|uniref:NPP1 family protein n=1 Tax=Nonomuraea lactucae TaxID=2249762 RepID=UPI000DE4F687|nr:NPP1 family protein [Nonomuraea lactucae]